MHNFLSRRFACRGEIYRKVISQYCFKYFCISFQSQSLQIPRNSCREFVNAGRAVAAMENCTISPQMAASPLPKIGCASNLSVTSFYLKGSLENGNGVLDGHPTKK